MKHIFLKIALLTTSFYLLTGCAISPNNINDNTALPSNNGVLVVGLHTDWEGHNNPLLASLKLMYIGKGDSDFSYKTMKFQGNNFIHVINLPANQYEFYLLSFGNRYMELNREKGQFNISPNEITYIGDIYANIDLSLFSALASLATKDELPKITKHMKTNYPILTTKYPLVKKIITIERRK